MSPVETERHQPIPKNQCGETASEEKASERKKDYANSKIECHLVCVCLNYFNTHIEIRREYFDSDASHVFTICHAQSKKAKQSYNKQTIYHITIYCIMEIRNWENFLAFERLSLSVVVVSFDEPKKTAIILITSKLNIENFEWIKKRKTH